MGAPPPALSSSFRGLRRAGGQGWPRKGTMLVLVPLHRWEDGGRGLQVPSLSRAIGDQVLISSFQQGGKLLTFIL